MSKDTDSIHCAGDSFPSTDGLHIVRQEQSVEGRREPTQALDLLEFIKVAVRDPSVDVSKMRALLDMQKEIVAEERRMVYVAEMTKLQHKLPQFKKSAKVEVKGTVRSRFAPIEDLDSVLRPLCFEHGFTIDDDVKPIDSKNILVITRVSHIAGHFVEKTMPVPIDFSDYRSGAQSAVASKTLACRHNRKMHFNIVEHGEDTDGNKTEKIGAEEAAKMKAAIEEFKGTGTPEFAAYLPKFLTYMKADSIGDILKGDEKKAYTAIGEAKRATQKAKPS